MKDINQSPFEAHGYRHVDPQARSVVQGVRRWMGSHPPVSTKKSHGKAASRPETKKTTPHVLLDKHSTEAIAMQLLEPNVSESEEAEYQGYIDQCQELLDAPSTMGERKDLEIYIAAVRNAGGEGLDWPEDAPRDLIAYVERGSLNYIDGSKKEPFPVTFNYERWLSGAGQL